VIEGFTDYTLDTAGNRLAELYNYSGGGDPEAKEDYNYNNSALMSSFANPFRDKTGIDYFFQDFPYISKVLQSSYSTYNTETATFEDSSSRIVYNYDTTLSIEEEVVKAATISLYPNPTHGLLKVETTKFNVSQMEFFSVLGN
jgi:hypothetical protein